MIIFLDLFCGAGGVTTGIERARRNKRKLGKVIACVNHDPVAIKSHAQNHKKVLHFVEDIRTLDLADLIRLVAFYKAKYPQAAFAIWASLECTNFSKAKGGKPRDADSRTLAEHLPRYINALNPDYIFIENVVEFMSWGPLDENGKPLSKQEGQDYIKWKESIESMGFRYGHKILNAADYGAYTKRERYFAQFAYGDLPIQWPTATHAKKASGDMFGGMKKWKPVKDVLDFSDEGKSIFNRKKDLSEKTLGRIYAGLLKYVANGNEKYLLKYLSNNQKTGINAGASIDEPSPTITCQNRLALVQTDFITKYYSNGGELSSTLDPAGTLTTKDRMALVQTKWLDKCYSGKDNHQSIEVPSGTLMTKDKFSIVSPKWIDRQFSSGGRDSSVEQPAGSILTVPKMSLVSTKKHNYLVNPQWNSKSAQSTDQPCFTLIARMDKAPPSLVVTESGQPAIVIDKTDSLIMKKIKFFMIEFGIIDIRMRMLKVKELLKIQGFPKNYKLAGTQADQKKFIGNSVVPQIAEAIIGQASISYVEYKQDLKLAA